MAADIGVVGLGVMGESLALNLDDHGARVAVWNLEREWVDRFLAENSGRRFAGTKTFGDLVASLDRPRRVLIMIKAGEPVDQTLAALLPLLDPEDIVIDGGNSHYLDTERRLKTAAARGVRYVGCGVSGGEGGARYGPSLMPGGDASAWPSLRPLFESIAAKSEFGPCAAWMGAGGAGHFVKMVHNGIEYADMQAIAEAYDLLRRCGGLDAGQLAAVFASWNEGELESFLLEVTTKIFRARDPETGRPLVDLIVDEAGQKGTGRWTAEVALERGVAAPTIAEAVFARIVSSAKAQRVAASSILAGPKPRVAADAADAVAAEARAALLGTRICAYAQGFALIAAASAENGWGVDLREVARVWTAGCIIRARLLRHVIAAFEEEPAARNVMLHGSIAELLLEAQRGWRAGLARFQANGIPAPTISSALAYYDAYRTAALPQNLTQAQRDYFGAHGYRRVDRPGETVHTEWEPLVRGE
ncbi:MAG TPA: NADP-dependent phosphogluconate dehydrogenase [Thermoanaerobaculia bacterium]